MLNNQPMDKLNKEMAQKAAQLFPERIFVFGEGPSPAHVLLVGEAPGAQEVLLGRPFVGKAGRNLDEFLRASAIERGSLYVTNTVKFRPTRQSEAGRTVNRTPTREEVTLMSPWLVREIALVRPRIIVTLGNTALRALCGHPCVIGAEHGVPRPYEGAPGGATLFPLYHPASVIYNRSLQSAYEQDMERLRALVSAVPARQEGRGRA